LSIDVRGDAWKRDIASPGSIASRTWTTARAQEAVPLAIAARKRSPLGDTVVDAAWLQTRLFGDRREDVYKYAILSSADQITLSLPSDWTTTANDAARDGADGSIDEAAVEVRLNGRPVPGAARAAGRVVVELPQRSGSQTWLVELVASRPLDALAGVRGRAAGMPAVVSLQPPVFPAGTIERRFYWELLLEPDEHPIGHPIGWTSQQRWEWGPLGLRRVPVVSRDVLAAWLNASCNSVEQAAPSIGLPAEPRLATATGLTVDVPGAGPRIVFSGVGSPGTGRIWVLPTWLLVLAVSAPVLAVGLLGVYLRRLRTVPVVLGLAAVASLAAAMFPELAPLVAQAAVPGVALTILAAVLRLIIQWRQPAPLPARGSPAVVSASSLTQVAPQPSLIIAPSSLPQREDATAAERGQP
jgi:hypothetical protein